MRLLPIAVVAGIVLFASGRSAAADEARVDDAPAWGLYDRLCLACHGHDGDGNGPARPWLWPAPRDLTTGRLKWRSAPGRTATRADVLETLRFGAAGTAMPGFADVLDEPQLEQLAEVVLRLGRGQRGPAASPGAPARAVELGAPPPADPARGAQLWSQRGCATCHGSAGRGDGPAAGALRDGAGRPAAPYDLTTNAVRRPRGAGAEAQRRAIALSVATGLDGTAMPAFGLPTAELWALADFVLGLRARSSTGARPLGALAAEAISADRQAPVAVGTWPGAGEPGAGALFGGPIALQGPAPPQLAPAQASLSSRQCARCHAAQVRQWRGSIHAQAASPGLLTQFIRTGPGGGLGRHDLGDADVSSCQRCHAPLAEQQPMLPAAGGGAYVENDQFAPGLRHEGITCAACHVRAWQRSGPPRLTPSLLSLPGYPRSEQAIYERADFCLPCHQLPARQQVAGRPLLNTYKEWLDGPYMPRGVQCQHCHMPNREHTFRGVHDRETFRQGIAVSAGATRERADRVEVRVEVRNVGAGHYLPTTPTPAAWLTVELIDGEGQVISGAHSRTRIGRRIAFVAGAWQELEDTRIAPGRALTVRKVWSGGRTAAARALRVRLEVHPDEYYEGFYRARLAVERHPAARAGFERALARALGNHYVAYEDELPVR